MNDQSQDGLTEVAARLRAAFAAQPMDDATLREAVCAFVDAAKLLGWPVERIIIEIKRIAEMEDARSRRMSPSDRIDGQKVVARAVSWCVEHYFGGR